TGVQTCALPISPQCLDWPARVLGDVLAAPAHRERLAVQPLSGALRARLLELEPFDPRVEHVVLGAGARALVGPLHVLDREARPAAGAAPAGLGAVREQTGGELPVAA